MVCFHSHVHDCTQLGVFGLRALIVLMYQCRIMFIIKLFLDIDGSLLNTVSSLTFLAQA